ncbi:MAG TPA: YraN family protein, partial [Luteimonas sp.]|nr:YraN family protein [Luteimonas sp.]
MRERGAAVEAAARDHLVDAGLRLVASNAAARVGELDLVMLDGATVVFVEVRYRRDTRFGGGAASVDAGKRRRLVRAAQQFLATHRQYRD